MSVGLGPPIFCQRSQKKCGGPRPTLRFLHGVPPSGCRHLVRATSMWRALRAASAANIGNPADVSPRAGEGFQADVSRFFLPLRSGGRCRRRMGAVVRKNPTNWPVPISSPSCSQGHHLGGSLQFPTGSIAASAGSSVDALSSSSPFNASMRTTPTSASSEGKRINVTPCVLRPTRATSAARVRTSVP